MNYAFSVFPDPWNPKKEKSRRNKAQVLLALSLQGLPFLKEGSLQILSGADFGDRCFVLLVI